MTFHLQLLLFPHKDLDWLVLYMAPHQPVFDILDPLTLALLTKAFEFCIV